MSIRVQKLALLIFALIIIGLFVLKIAQVGRFAAIGYRDFSGIETISSLSVAKLGIAMRIDDFSFWNAVAGFWAAIGIFLSQFHFNTTTNRSRDRVAQECIANLFSWRLRHFMWWFAWFAFYTSIYLWIVRDQGSNLDPDEDPCKGTFFSRCEDPIGDTIQSVEGMLIVLMIALVSAFLTHLHVLVSVLTRPGDFLSSQYHKVRDVVNGLMMASTFPASTCLIIHFLINKYLGKEAILASYPMFVYDSTSIGELSISILCWYGPYVLVFCVVMWNLRGSPYRVEATFSSVPPWFRLVSKRTSYD